MAINELFDSNSAMYVIGYAMKVPKILTSDKYLLTLDDFATQLHKMIFGAIYNLACEGPIKISSIDIDLYLGQYPEQYKIFQEGQGLNYLNQIEELESGDDEALFDLHYNRLKKFTILRELNKQGIDTTEFYNPRVDIFKIDEENDKLNRLTTSEIIDLVRLKLAKIEKKNVSKGDEYFQTAAKGLRNLMQELKENPEVGPSMEGDKLTYVTRGARFGKYYIVSMPAGNGKTRFMLSQLCRFAFPRIEGGKIVYKGTLRKVFYVATEQLPDEIQTMIVANVSGVSEEKIISGALSPEEENLVELAVQIIEKYQDNFLIDVITEPSMTNVRARLLEVILDKNVEMVCFDYLYLPTDDDQHSASHQYRSDQLLMMLSNQLKQLAAVYNVFMLSATQMNGTWEDKMVRNQNMIRDAKSIADKADVGMIGVKCTDQEFEMVKTYFEQLNISKKPNQVIDVYKNRRGSMVNIKIFRYFDYATLRAEDLLVTTQGFKMIENAMNSEIVYNDQKKVSIEDFLAEGVESNG